ncbi:MAG: ribosome-associated translation inhibitor RaiA [Caldilineae bacterium]|nr:MAG: ribosome-associated translation inhibitor RaiA [Caldilineae bacterium]
MTLVLKGKNISLYDRTKAYVEKKVSKFHRFLPNIIETRVELSKENTRSNQHRFIAEITVHTKQKILRAEERSHDLHAAIDVAVDKLNSQIYRLKGKQINRWQAHESIRNEDLPPLPEEALDQIAREQESKIVRVKQFSVHPMDEQEAIEQMQLLSHDFFVFYNANVGRINVLYRRADNNYGLLDPVVA